MNLKLLVTGATGQVDRSIKALGEQAGVDVRCIGYPDIDLANLSGFETLIAEVDPHVVVNSAAYTQVDNAETDKDLAFAVNAQGAERVARAAAQCSVPVIQLSTDYVFSGDKPIGEAYHETDETGPMTVYGASKLAGETAVQKAAANHVILRTAWVYSALGNNFLKTMLRVGAERHELGVVNDQFGAPTHAETIAGAVLKIAEALVKSDEEALRGVFHLTNSGAASWYDFAREIFQASKRMGGPSPIVSPIPSKSYPTPAVRPLNSVLNCAKTKTVYGITPEDWRAPISETVSKVLKDTGL